DYAVELGVVRQPNSPILALRLDDGSELATVDASGTNPTYATQRLRFGQAPGLKQGAHTLMLLYKGKAAADKRPELYLDFIHLRKSRYANSIEAESLKILDAKDGQATHQEMAGFGPDWSGDDQFWFLGQKAGAEAPLELPIQTAGKYTLSA